MFVLASPAGRHFISGHFWRLTLGVDEAVVGDVRGHPAAHGPGGGDGVADRADGVLDLKGSIPQIYR